MIKTLRLIACKLWTWRWMHNSHRSSTQINARGWPNEVTRKPMLKTCLYLRICFERYFKLTFIKSGEFCKTLVKLS